MAHNSYGIQHMRLHPRRFADLASHAALRELDQATNPFAGDYCCYKHSSTWTTQALPGYKLEKKLNHNAPVFPKRLSTSLACQQSIGTRLDLKREGRKKRNDKGTGRTLEYYTPL